MSKKPYILGISSFYHDSSAALLLGDQVVAATQEERFTRRKFEKNFPEKAVQSCLDQAGIKLRDVDTIAFYEEPLLKWDRIFTTYLHYETTPFKCLKRLKDWLDNKFKVEDLIYHRYLNGFKGNIIFTQHHMAHAASAFYPSPFDEATICTIDGVGEWSCTSIGHGKAKEIKLIKEQRFPHSIGFLYSAFTQYIGFKVDSGEYKVMGLAPYGKPVYSDLIKEKIAKIDEDGTLELTLEHFDFMTGSSMISESFGSVFGQPKRSEDSDLTQFHFDIAASIQDVTEEIVKKVVKHAVEITGQRKVVMAGGVALNCVANGKLLREKIVDDLWIQPCSGDGGGSIGGAYIVAHQHYKLDREVLSTDGQKGSYLGPKFSNDEIFKILDTFQFNYKLIDDTDYLLDVVTDEIVNGNVIGFFQGRMEYGARALGARSIIADPRNRKMQEVLNLKIKFRESFRPFAPIVMEDKTKEWFEGIEKSPYMLLTTQVLPEKLLPVAEEDNKKRGIELLNVERSKVPAITHVNNSARLQTVSQERNGRVYDLLQKFEGKTGCPILINTSFNVRGEPIVCSPYDALQCFMNTNIDVLVLENYILYKKDQNKQLVKKEFLEYLNYG